MTAAQRVMAIAMLYPEPAKTAPGRSSPTGSATEGVSTGRLSMARAVPRYSPALADAASSPDIEDSGEVSPFPCCFAAVVAACKGDVGDFSPMSASIVL